MIEKKGKKILLFLTSSLILSVIYQQEASSLTHSGRNSL